MDREKVTKLLEEAERNAKQLERSGNLNSIHHEQAAKYREMLKSAPSVGKKHKDELSEE